MPAAHDEDVKQLWAHDLILEPKKQDDAGEAKIVRVAYDELDGHLNIGCTEVSDAGWSLGFG